MLAASAAKRLRWRHDMQNNAEFINIPAHIALILDGNGRWAKQRGLPRSMGHRQGVKALGPIVDHCIKIGVKYLTLYVFSTENWSRPDEEVKGIMNLLREQFKNIDNYVDRNVRIKILGDISRLDSDLIVQINDAVLKSAENTALTVCFALNYGGRDELVNAAKKISSKVLAGEISPDEITAEHIADNIYTAGMPDPDIIIRPSGEKRLSNFLLWQCAYSEFVFMDILWPDFKPEDLDKAIEEFSARSRRFGGI